MARSQVLPRPYALLALLLGAGCATPGYNNESNSDNYAEAAVAVAAGAALWAAGGGCNMQGCPYGSYCDAKSGYCEMKKCSEGCPDGTVCNEGLDRCQMAAPPRVANDYLPQDDARQLPTQ